MKPGEKIPPSVIQTNMQEWACLASMTTLVLYAHEYVNGRCQWCGWETKQPAEDSEAP